MDADVSTRVLERVRDLRVAEIAGVDAGGRAMIASSDGGGSAPVALAAWLPLEVDWRASSGRRVLVGDLGGDGGAILLAWIDPPARARAESLALEAERELVLRCGKAKIALRADGRVEILGGYLLSRSTGPNKIKGASVDIN